jgi:hypothetical protein
MVCEASWVIDGDMSIKLYFVWPHKSVESLEHSSIIQNCLLILVRILTQSWKKEWSGNSLQCSVEVGGTTVHVVEKTFAIL